MPKPTPFSLSKFFSHLLGRKVLFTQTVASVEIDTDQIYGIYDVVLFETALVVKADLHVIGAFAGSLMGLPSAVVKERLHCDPLDDLLHDAMLEVFNILSGAIADQGRTVFTAMVCNKSALSPAAMDCIEKPGFRSYFNVTVEGYGGGRFAILAPLPQGNDGHYWEG